jgi:hypothetical protein
MANLNLLLPLSAFLLLLSEHQANAAGTWTALANSPPVGVNNCLLLSDGTVLGMNGAGQCVKLTPDIHGSYINGTWTTLATMNSSRLFFSSDVLTNGNVFVAGGEYGDANHYDAELYDSLANTWTIVPGSQSPNFNYSDSPSELLPNGNVLESDSQSAYNFYNVASNMMIHGEACGDMNEVCWVKLANTCIFAVDNYGDGVEHFVSSTGQWVVDANSTPSGFQGGDDTDYLLPNGQVFHVGSTTNTGFYTPGATATSAGTLTDGPNLPIVGTNQLVGGESPGAVLADGNVLLELAPNGGGANGGAPAYFYEYNYQANTFTATTAPGGGLTYGNSPFVTSMLDLPDGSVLFVGGQNSSSLYIYTPVGTPLTAGQPIINSITENPDGSYHLTGTNLNGISEGAMFGDDEQMACNYPLVRMTNNVSGNVYYARTYNWSSTTVQNPNQVTTEFSLPANLPPGTYSLVVLAVGNPSAPVTFTYAPPAAPTGLTGTAGNAQAVLSWNAVSGATAYNLRCLIPTATPLYYALVATVTGTSCTNVGLVNAYTYSYVVTTVGAEGESTNSAALMLTPSGPPPIPTNVTATPDTFARIDLAWTPSYAAANYIIERSTTSGGPYTNLASSVNPFYTDTGLASGTTYYYVISAVSAKGQSSNFVEVSATAQAIANFGFEVPSIGNYQYLPTGAFWTFGGTNGGYGSGIVANGSGFNNPPAPQGAQAAFIQGYGFISQVLSGFTPGMNYTITYSAAQRSGIYQHGGETWNVTIDGAVIQTNTPGSTSYTTFTASFTASAATHTLAFVGTDLAGGDNTVFIDNILISPILQPVAPVVTLTAPTNNATVLVPPAISLTASVVTNGNIVSGVQFYYDTTNLIGQDSSPPYSYNWTSPNTGDYSVFARAIYNGGSVADSPAAVITVINTNISWVANGTFTDDSVLSLAGAVSNEVYGVDFGGSGAQTTANGYTFNDYATSGNMSVAGSPPSYGGYLTGGATTGDAALNSILTHGVYGGTANTGTLNNLTVGQTYTVIALLDDTRGSAAGGTTFTVTDGVTTSPSQQYAFANGSPTVGGYIIGTFTATATTQPYTIENLSAVENSQYNAILLEKSSDFSLSANPSILSIAQGDNGTSTITANDLNGFTGSVNLSASGLPSGVTASFNPSPTTGTSAVTLTAATNATPGMGTVTITGTSGSLAHTTTISLTVTPPPSVVLTSPTNNAVFSAANPVNLAATVSTNGNTIVGVQFCANTSNLIAQVTSPYAYAWSNANAGASTVFARLVFNGSNTVDSSMVNITVTNPPPVAVGIGFSTDGLSLNLQGTGLPNRPYYLNVASNLVPPVIWTPLLTNMSDVSGNIIFTNLWPTNVQQFFRLSAP